MVCKGQDCIFHRGMVWHSGCRGMAINLATVIFDSVTMGDTAHATRRIVTKSILRYVVVVILFVLFGYFQWGNLIAAFLGLLGLKIGAYLQPLWEKVKGRR